MVCHKSRTVITFVIKTIKAKRSLASLKMAGALCLIVFLALEVADTAMAHAKLVRADPADGRTMANPPQFVVAVFDEELATRGNVLTVVDQNGSQVDTGDNQLDLDDLDRRTVKVHLTAIGPGHYTVRWKVVSADDRAITEGQYRFRVAAPGESTESGPTYPLGLLGVGTAVVGFLLIVALRLRSAPRQDLGD